MSQDHANPPKPAPNRLADRVMAAIANEPVPTPTRALLSAARSWSIHDAASALWVAWHLATVRRWHVGVRVRARSFALVLAVTAVLGTASVAGAAALRVAAGPIIDLVRPGVVELAPFEQPPAEAGPVPDPENQDTDEDDDDAASGEEPDSDGSDDVDDEDDPGNEDPDDEDDPADEDPDDVEPRDGDSDVGSPDDEDDPEGDESDDDESDDEPDGEEDGLGGDPEVGVNADSDAGEDSTD